MEDKLLYWRLFCLKCERTLKTYVNIEFTQLIPSFLTSAYFICFNPDDSQINAITSPTPAAAKVYPHP